jgi:predicted transcriptional regulator
MRKRQRINSSAEISVFCVMYVSRKRKFLARDIARRIHISTSSASLTLRRLAMRGVIERRIVTYASRSRSKNNIYEYSVRKKNARVRSLFLACLGLENLPIPRKGRFIRGRCGL